eukprot:1027446-Lingulodinium_polyedra.AAC.1
MPGRSRAGARDQRRSQRRDPTRGYPGEGPRQLRHTRVSTVHQERMELAWVEFTAWCLREGVPRAVDPP